MPNYHHNLSSKNYGEYLKLNIKNISTMSNIEKTQHYLTSIEDLKNLMLVWRLNLAFEKNAHQPEENELATCLYEKLFITEY